VTDACWLSGVVQHAEAMTSRDAPIDTSLRSTESTDGAAGASVGLSNDGGVASQSSSAAPSGTDVVLTVRLDSGLTTSARVTDVILGHGSLQEVGTIVFVVVFSPHIHRILLCSLITCSIRRHRST
jgi:hypothetical protein